MPLTPIHSQDERQNKTLAWNAGKMNLLWMMRFPDADDTPEQSVRLKQKIDAFIADVEAEGLHL
jgi:hypothetical protein